MRVADEREFVPKNYWEARLREKWGLHGVGQISLGLAYNNWLYGVRRKVFRRHLATLPLNLSNSKVLDVGSGTGFWLQEWKSLGVRDLTGLDVTEVAVARLREKYADVRLVEQDITDPNISSDFLGKFDIVSAFDVLFHIVDEEAYCRALANVSQLLSANGFFIFSEFFIHGAVQRVTHEVNRPIAEIERQLIACGLKPILRVPVFVLMNGPVDVAGRWPLLLWRLAMAPMHFVPVLGHLYGALLSPLDLLLTRVLRDSPTTEMMVCQKMSDESDRRV